MTYTIEIRETLARPVEVEADNLRDAINLLKQQYRNREIVLTAEDHIDTEFLPEEGE